MSEHQKVFPFVKMHGAGNDFIVMDARADGFPLEIIKEHASRLCRRRTGIGADGILLLAPSPDADYTMHYLNADGSEAGMCGNGARCLAKFAVQNGFPEKLTFTTQGVPYEARVHDRYISVCFPIQPEPVEREIENRVWYDVHAGTEHVVSIDPDNRSTPDETLRITGRHIRNMADLFPKGTNVNFASVIDENRLKLVTYERGVENLTLSCGTGAIATAIAWIYKKYRSDSYVIDLNTEHHIQLDCPGGLLEVSFGVLRSHDKIQFKNIVLHGPAVSVYEGQFSF